MKKLIPIVFLPFVVLSFINCTSTKAQTKAVGTTSMAAPSIEGTWELVNQYNYDGTNVTDTISVAEGYRQIKMYYNGKVMWTRYVPDDSAEWFGYGSYKATNNKLTEKLEYMSATMRKLANKDMEWNMELQLEKNKFSQIFVDEDGNRISSENYKRID